MTDEELRRNKIYEKSKLEGERKEERRKNSKDAKGRKAKGSSARYITPGRAVQVRIYTHGHCLRIHHFASAEKYRSTPGRPQYFHVILLHMRARRAAGHPAGGVSVAREREGSHAAPLRDGLPERDEVT